MYYSTLQEAYNLDSFDKKLKKKKDTKPEIPDSNSVKGPANLETSKLSASSEKIDDYKETVQKNSQSCSPIQAPMYSIPSSDDCKNEFKNVMKVYTEENFNNTKDIDMSNMASTNNIMPYYDEDLEQYFDVNNLNDEVKYNPNNPNSPKFYMPNNNNNSYTNNNTAEYSNNNTIFNNGNNLLNTSQYNLNEEERKKVSEALKYLKSMENKIESDEKNAYSKQFNSDLNYNNSQGNKSNNDDKTKQLEKEIEELKKREVILSKNIEENKKTQYNINLIINIFIILFIGVIIILLCDYLVDLSIQLGMKKTTNILEPYINNNHHYHNYQPHQLQHYNYINQSNMPHNINNNLNHLHNNLPHNIDSRPNMDIPKIGTHTPIPCNKP